MAVQVFLAPEELAQAEYHADARGAEPVAPAVGLSQVAADDRGKQRAQVDAGVEQRETGVSARIVLRVQLADDRGDVRLEESNADDDQGQREVKNAKRALVALHDPGHGLRGVAFERHAEVPQAQQDAAEHHRLAHAQPAVGEHAAEHRQGVNQAAVGAQHVKANAVAEFVVLDQVEQQQRLHAIEAEAFPHLGEEADVDALRVAEEVLAARHWGVVQAGGVVCDAVHGLGSCARPEYSCAPLRCSLRLPTIRLPSDDGPP